jgi:hypothetical protein
MPMRKPQDQTRENGLTAEQLSSRKKDAMAMARLLYDIHKRRVTNAKIGISDSNEHGGKDS